MAWSLLIRNGTVVDGTGAPARGRRAVEGDRSPPWAGSGRRGGARDRRTGLMVAPGFIDIHSHSDLRLRGPSAESKIRQGVTTEVVGKCGFSPAPGRPGPRGSVQDWAGGIGGKLPFTWNTFGEYLDHAAGARPLGQRRAVRRPGALRLAAIGPGAAR